LRPGSRAGYRLRVRKRLLPIALLVALALPVVAGASPTATTSVIGGHDAQAASWPSIAFLLSAWDENGDGVLDGAFSCTGTVIKPQWILTAAHCAFGPDDRPVDAMLSITGVADVNDPIGEAIAADRVVLHDRWNPARLIGDAMLMHLEAPSSRPAMPLARPGGQYAPDPSIPNVAGWGRVDEASEIGTAVLQEAHIGLVDDTTCAAFAAGFEAATQKCAGTYQVAGVCHGDSGGPLTVVDGAKVRHLWGLTSYGPQLAHPGFLPCDLRSPAVFSWVPPFAAWVDATAVDVAPPPPPGPEPRPQPQRPVPSAPRDATAPVLSGARLSTSRIKATKKGATITRKAGAKLTFSLSEAAAVRVSVRKGARTLAPGATIAARAGRTARRFTGRLGSKRLKPGRFTLQLGAVDAAGNAGKPARVRFRIVR
jgi:secreted trypsin-like serine protease